MWLVAGMRICGTLCACYPNIFFVVLDAQVSRNTNINNFIAYAMYISGSGFHVPQPSDMRMGSLGVGDGIESSSFLCCVCVWGGGGIQHSGDHG